MSAMATGVDTSRAVLRPIWLRPATAALALAAHGLVLAVVLWPKDVPVPPERDIEITVVPQQSARGSHPPASAAVPEAPPAEAQPIEMKPIEASEAAPPSATSEAAPVEMPAKITASPPPDPAAPPLLIFTIVP